MCRAIRRVDHRAGHARPRRETPASTSTFSLRSSGARPLMSAWRSRADGAQQYRSRGALQEKPDQREPVTCLASPRPPSMGIHPRVMPFVGRHVGQVADVMIEARHATETLDAWPTILLKLLIA